ncbi:hypothetical protein H9P43_003354 [Blastocladiella emersonii ATCC 22665]|nr:hypothetical protein H9P43_003354 [Blastocladiella emersonii ATCC 22665]
MTFGNGNDTTPNGNHVVTVGAESPAATPRSTLADIEAFIPELMAALGSPGLTATVYRAGERIIHRGFGVKSVNQAADAPGNSVDVHSLFDLCSVTKAMTSACVAVLVHRGLVSWDAPVRTYLPELKFSDPVLTERATVLDLLAHRTGVAGHDEVWEGSGRMALASYSVLDRIEHLGVGGPFRASLIYSNLMYCVATVLVERVSGVAFPDFVAEHILTPLGMTDAVWCSEAFRGHANAAQPHEVVPTFDQIVDAFLRPAAEDAATPPEDLLASLDAKAETPLSPEDAARLAAAPFAVTQIAGVDEDNRTAAGTGFLYPSADDMLKWAQCWLAGGLAPDGKTRVIYEMDKLVRVHNHDWYETEAEATRGIRSLGYGCGWVVKQFGEYEILYHSGHMPGQLTLLALVPGAGIAMYFAENVDNAHAGQILYSLYLEALLAPRRHPNADGPFTVDAARALLPKAKWKSMLELADEMHTVLAGKLSADDQPGADLRHLVGVYHHPAYGYWTIISDESLATRRLRLIRAPETNVVLRRVHPAATDVGDYMADPTNAHFAFGAETMYLSFRPSADPETGIMATLPAPRRNYGAAWVPRTRYDLVVRESSSQVDVVLKRVE